MFQSVAEYLCPALVVIAEETKAEEVLEPCSVDLVPAHCLKVSRSHANQLAASLQRFEHLHDTRADLGRELKMIGFDFAADYIERDRKLRPKIRIRDSRAPNR